jgi:hypothetical protein
VGVSVRKGVDERLVTLQQRPERWTTVRFRVINRQVPE